MNTVNIVYNRLIDNEYVITFIDDFNCKLYLMDRFYIKNSIRDGLFNENIHKHINDNILKQYNLMRQDLPEYSIHCFSTQNNTINKIFFPLIELIYKNIYIYFCYKENNLVIFDGESNSEEFIVDSYIRDNSGYIYLLDSELGKGMFCVWYDGNINYYNDIKKFEDYTIMLGLY